MKKSLNSPLKSRESWSLNLHTRASLRDSIHSSSALLSPASTRTQPYTFKVTPANPTFPQAQTSPDTILLPWAQEGEAGGLQDDTETVAALLALEAKDLEFLWNGSLVSDDMVWGRWLEAPGLLQLVQRVPVGYTTLQVQYNAQTHLFKIAPTVSILDLKQELETWSSVPLGEQVLIWGERVLANCYQTIEGLGLMAGQTLSLRRKPEPSCLYLALTDWWKRLVEVDLEATGLQLKEQMGRELGYAPRDFLILQETKRKVLSESQTLSSAGVGNEDTLILKYQNIGFRRTISVTFPEGHIEEYEFDQRTSLLNLITDLSKGHAQTLLLNNQSNRVLTAYSKPISKLSREFTLLDVSNLDRCVLIEREFGEAYMVKDVRTVGEAKRSLEKDLIYPQNEQILVYDEKILENDCEITEEMAKKAKNVPFQLILLSDIVTLYVYKAGNAWICLQLAYRSSIKDLKAQIEAFEGISAASQLLIFNGLVLCDDFSLSACGLLPENSLLLLTFLPLAPNLANMVAKLIENTYNRLKRSAKDTAFTLIRKLQAEFRPPVAFYALLVNGQMVPYNQPVPMVIGSALELRKVEGSSRDFRTNLMYLSAVLTGKLAPAVFFPESQYDSGTLLSLADCRTLLSALLMKGRVNSPLCPDTIAVTIWPLAGQSIALTIQSAATIWTVKQQILGVCGVPIDLQRLLFAGDVLEDSKQVREYSIRGNDCLLLVPVLSRSYYTLPTNLFKPDIPIKDPSKHNLIRCLFSPLDNSPCLSLPLTSFHGLSSFSQFPSLLSSLVQPFSGPQATKVYSRKELKSALKWAGKWQLWEGCAVSCVLEWESWAEWKFTETFEGEVVAITRETYTRPVALLVQEHFSSIEISLEHNSQVTKLQINPGRTIQAILKEYEKKLNQSFTLCRLELKGNRGNRVIYDSRDLQSGGNRRICDVDIEAGAEMVLFRYEARDELLTSRSSQQVFP